ncbi:unnamed protein product [Chrysoparadoxa australica]
MLLGPLLWLFIYVLAASAFTPPSAPSTFSTRRAMTINADVEGDGLSLPCKTNIQVTSDTSVPGVTSDRAPVWDQVNGIWVGEKAAGITEIPDPLWLFGYGSLCWKPEAGWESFDRQVKVHVKGWKRLFAQLSMDHRGTPTNPGLVATLVSDTDLEKLGVRSSDDEPSVTYGAAYRIPQELAEEVLGVLDFREKGGYTRAMVDVHNDEGTLTRALLYTGTVCNPNFSLKDEEEASSIIAAAVGPSGPNHEYLLQLGAYLREHGCSDDHVAILEELVIAKLQLKQK